MNTESEITDLLKQHGAEILRRKKHEVWLLPNGTKFTRPTTPSDRRSSLNQLSTLRQMLGVTKESKERKGSMIVTEVIKKPQSNGKATTPAVNGKAYQERETGPAVRSMTITPEIAKKWLDGNGSNRPLSKRLVQRIAGEIKAGAWLLNGETIKFSISGALIDGQHRLSAVVSAGRPIDSFVVFGMPNDVFHTIDTGHVRTHSDILSIKGERNTTLLAATVKLLDRYVTERLASASAYTNAEIALLLEMYPNARTSVSFANQRHHNFRICSPTVLATVHYIFHEKDTAAADAFLFSLINGANLQIGDPIHTLRRKLEFNASNAARLRPEAVLAIIIRAWNAWRTGASISSLRVTKMGQTAAGYPKAK